MVRITEKGGNKVRDGYNIKQAILIGKQSKSDGDFFERMIDDACERYANSGVALIDKTPEPMKPLKPIGKGKFVACFTKHAQPDYKGTLKGGRSVVFEAKMTTDIKMLQSRVTEWQLEALQKHEALGAKTFILIYFMNYNCCFKIPTKIWADMKQYFGRRYVLFNELDNFKVPTSGMRIDFLEDEIGSLQN